MSVNVNYQLNIYNYFAKYFTTITALIQTAIKVTAGDLDNADYVHSKADKNQGG